MQALQTVGMGVVWNGGCGEGGAGFRGSDRGKYFSVSTTLIYGQLLKQRIFKKVLCSKWFPKVQHAK